jgi:HNH endonuclease
MMPPQVALQPLFDLKTALERTSPDGRMPPGLDASTKQVIAAAQRVVAALDDRPEVRRFWARIERGSPENCWPYRGAPRKHGYGSVIWEGKPTSPHRVAYLLAHGSPRGGHVKHTCGYKLCCNPAHLYATGRPDVRRTRENALGEAWQGECRRHGPLPEGRRSEAYCTWCRVERRLRADMRARGEPDPGPGGIDLDILRDSFTRAELVPPPRDGRQTRSQASRPPAPHSGQAYPNVGIPPRPQPTPEQWSDFQVEDLVDLSDILNGVLDKA